MKLSLKKSTAPSVYVRWSGALYLRLHAKANTVLCFSIDTNDCTGGYTWIFV